MFMAIPALADKDDAARAAQRRAEAQQQITYAQSSDTVQPHHIVLIGIVGVIYFLPLWVAFTRKCKAGAGIGVVNLFLGWTFIGWVVALAWAACGEPKPNAPNLPSGQSVSA
jgi:hypothetical protein